MLSDVRAASDARLREVRVYVDDLAKQDQGRPVAIRTGFTAAKGLFFVHLYGALEYTVTQAVQRAIQSINQSSPSFRDLKAAFFSIALDSECKAVAAVGPTKVWPKRWELFERTVSGDAVHISDAVFPADGFNLKIVQMESVWRSFCLPGSVVPKPELRGRLDELAENRNRIAHGRESATSVGSRYSTDDLRIRLTDIDGYCSYVIQTFDAYLTGRDYIA